MAKFANGKFTPKNPEKYIGVGSHIVINTYYVFN